MVPVACLVCVGALAPAVWFMYEDREHARTVLTYLYIVSAVLFILGLKGLSSPKCARQGMFLAEFGMVVAIVGTLFHHDIKPSVTSGSSSACSSARSSAASMGLRIPMTAVPQRTALSHSLGALAATLVGIAEYVRSWTKASSAAS